VWNKASEKILLKNGMVFVKYVEKGYFNNGQWVAVNILSKKKS
jgi:RimJ/RimL family protein N-acetyltransferase